MQCGVVVTGSHEVHESHLSRRLQHLTGDFNRCVSYNAVNQVSSVVTEVMIVCHCSTSTTRTASCRCRQPLSVAIYDPF